MINEARFKPQVDTAVQKIKEILGLTRNPVLAENVPHEYEDKFGIAAWSTSLASIALLNGLEEIGLSADILDKYRQHHENGEVVNLRFYSSPKAVFIRKAEKQTESGTTKVEESTNFLGQKSVKTKKVLHTVTEYYWKVIHEWKLSLFVGPNSSNEETVIFERKDGTYELRVVGKESNPLANYIISDRKLPFNFLLNLLNKEEGQLEFKIDRSKESCRTPRRNADIDAAFQFMNQLLDFSSKLYANLSTIMQIESHRMKDKMKDLYAIIRDEHNTSFVPIAPVMEQNDNDALGAMMKIEDLHQILVQQKEDLRTLTLKIESITEKDESKYQNLMSTREAKAMSIALHLRGIGNKWQQAINKIEGMLYQQLKDAVGKEITSKAFNEYMRFHNQKIYNEVDLPKPFCYAIRRPNHYPEGELSIESREGDGKAHVLSSVRKAENPHMMYFSLNAATNVQFGGDRYLHACVNNQFGSKRSFGKTVNSNFSIHARARQFSSFILMIGTVATSKKFDVKHAIIIKDKDELRIPLNMETIPTAKEFKEAISSISPEQQRFAKAFRKMQLSSTLFAIAVVQIKPQLEKLLNLPDDSLTKEIKLTQSLMDLFIKYQIPSDLISYDSNIAPLVTSETKGGDEEMANRAGLNNALNQVKSHVEKMNNMISDLKNEDLQQKAQVAMASRLESVTMATKKMVKMRVNQMHGMAPLQRRIDDDDDAYEEESSGSSGEEFFAMAAPSARGRGGRGGPRGGGGRGRPRGRGGRGGMTRAPRSDPNGGKKRSQTNESDNVNNNVEDGNASPEQDLNGVEDYTLLPSLLEKRCTDIDPTAKLRPTIINVVENWQKKYQESILSATKNVVLDSSSISQEKDKAFDLLDALSKSGSISLDAVELHIVMASTHCFDETVVDTVVRRNENPIEEIERSLLIMSSTIQNKPIQRLINMKEIDRIKNVSPMLFPTLTNE